MQALEAGQATDAFGPLSEGLTQGREMLLAAGVLPRRLDELREILGSESPSTDAVISRLLSLEGEVRGTLLRTGETPSGEIDYRRRLVEGMGEIGAAGVVEADRFIRASFITGLERGLGRQPFGIPHHVRRTRLGRFKPLEGVIGRPVYLKLEDRQPVGSFKIRGSTNFLVNAFLSGRDMTHVRLGCASHGNHALGLVQAARNLGISPDRVHVFLPTNASPLKIDLLKDLGATVILQGETFEEAEAEVRRRAAEEADFLFVPAFDHPLVVMGQGTVGLEIGLQMAHRGHDHYGVVVPTGGGGLIAGIAVYLEEVPVYGVESEAVDMVSRSFRAREIVHPAEVRHVETHADGIALLHIGQHPFPTLLRHVRDVVTVSEEEIDGGVSFLDDHHLTVEGAAAAPVAALLYGRLQVTDPDLPLVLAVTGRNIDPALLGSMTATYGRGQWRRAVRRRFERILAEAGFMEGDHVRDLRTPQEGIELADLLARHCPPAWDLIDIFDLLDWGPWRPSGGKDLNATFRSYTPIGGGLDSGRNRWGGSKEMALLHPMDSRGLMVTGGADMMEMMEKGPGFATSRYEGCVVQQHWLEVSRLFVELHILNLYLERPEWLLRLEPRAIRLEDHEIARFVESAKRTKDSIETGFGRLAEMLGVTVDFLKRIEHEEEFRRLFGPRRPS